MSFLRHAPEEERPLNPIWAAEARYAADTSKHKINLASGVICDQHTGQPVYLEAVAEAERRLAANPYSKVYPPLGGIPGFVSACREFLGLDEKTAASVAASSCSAITMAFHALRRLLPGLRTVYTTAPAWPMYAAFARCAGLAYAEVPYINAAGCAVDLDGLVAAIGRLDPATDALVLQAVGYNPACIDLTGEQFAVVAQAVSRRGVAVVLDVAYQGVGRDIRADLAFKPVLQLANQALVCQFFDKSFSIYAEGASCLHAVTDEPRRLQAVLEGCVNDMLGVAPVHGQHLVATIKHDPDLYQRYLTEMERIRGHLAEGRRLIIEHIKRSQAARVQELAAVLERQAVGVFLYLGLSEGEIQALARHGVYVSVGGRINVCNVSSDGARMLADALVAVLKTE